MEADVESEEKSNILYDLTIQTEWQLDPEAVFRPTREKSQVSFSGRLTSSATRSAWTFLRTVGIPVGSGSPCLLPPGLVKLINTHLSWHFDVSKDGRQVALLQDQTLEVRTSRDDFANHFSKWSVPKDLYPQWRALAWSCDGDMIAYSNSMGSVTVYDIVGTKICYIQSLQIPNPTVPIDLSSAVCGLIFKETNDLRKDRQWDTELMIVNFQGTLKNYAISRTSEVSLLHNFSFGSQYSHGIGSVVYSPAQSILYVGGGAEPVSQRDTDEPTAMQLGITAWRILSDLPHYKLVTDYETDLQLAQRRSKLLKKLKHLYSWSSEEQDGIYKLCLSPSNQLLAAVHQSGSLTILEAPSLRIQHTWEQEEQPSFNEVNQAIAENPKKSKHYKEYLTAFYLTDLNWWSDEAIILARGTGAVTVSSVGSLRNLLGPSPEWFEGVPALSMARNGGFLGLECDYKYSQLKRHHVSDQDDNYEDSDDELEATLVSRSAKYMRQALYYVTDSEKFQPPRKRPKLVTKTYRLVCLKSTTPEELYERKIDNEEYGEALALAKAYQLDCDRVYQRQWRKTPVSVASIQDYLSKISKRSWVLHECLERVPENIDAMRELLQYGLRGTDLEALIAIGKGEDGGRFILCDRHDVYDDSIDPFDMQAVEESKDVEKKYIQDLLDQVDFKRLDLQQVELCRARAKLVQYLDRLATYEEILGGTHYAPDRYEPKFFEKFRSNNIVEQAVQYSRDCDWQALDILLTYHGSDILPYRLAVLSNFPETYPPRDYRMLLPQITETGDSVIAWEQQAWKDADWCQQAACRSMIDPSPPDLGNFLFEENPELLKFRGEPLNTDQVQKWYKYRACEIEQLSRQVDHALELITIATSDKNVQGLERLQDDLVTMNTLVYDCNIDDSLTFQHFLEMSNIDRLRQHMSQSSEEMYSKNIKRWLVPFLQRCDKHEPGSFQTLMQEYLVSLAKTDLSDCLKVFESCRADQPKPVIADEYLVMSMALQCVYTCESDDQLSNAYGILECLPQRGFGMITEQSTKLHNQVDELECHLSAAEILEKHGLPQTIAFIKSTQHDVEEAKALFTKLTRKAGNRSTSLTDKEWKKLLQDLLAVRDKVYQCVDSSVCYQIFVESLLCSSNLDNISLAGKMVERTSAESQQPDYSLPDLEEDDIIKKVAYPRAVELVLTAAREYFDSSTNLTDVSMDLARACLGLIEDKPTSVCEELDLIDALALLDGFGVNILPLQVRMCSTRLDLVQRAINAKAFTYKNSQRLLKLGQFLRVEGDTKMERDGRILRLITQAALKARDMGVSYHTCQRLMDLGYPEVWRECKLLAELDDFHNIQAKTELLSFAVTHCSPEMIEPILRAKCLLETQTLYERVHNKMADRDSLSPIENPFTPKGAIQQTKEILSTTNKATRQVLSSVSNKAWWKKTLKSLHPLNKDSRQDDTDDRNQGYDQQGFHPFYEPETGECYINKVEVDYEALSASRPDVGGFHFSESLLYTAKLEETLSEGDSYHPSPEVLLQLAQDALSVDASLGLSYLLALPKATQADETFHQNPGTDISLQLAAYYYALQMYSHLDQSTPAGPKALYHYAPMELVQKMRSHAKWKEDNKRTDAWDEEMKILVEKLEHYNELLADYNQAQILKKLDRGIDIGRFTVDAEYKKETILGLAMTCEDTVYQISVSLARRYNLPLWDVYMGHLEYLFDSGLATTEIESRAARQDILGTLQAEGGAFYERMEAYVYPGICGTDHARLHLYYSLLEGSHTDRLITPSNHVKLLKKIKNTAPGLDYKQLTDGKHDPLDVLRPVLTAENINTLAKLAARLPDQRGGYLQASVVYCGWAIQTFWQGGKKTPGDKTDWIHRYEACGEYMHKLLPGDVMRFVNAITFVPDALAELAVDVRRQIVRRALKYTKQQLSSSKKTKSDGPHGSLTWDGVLQNLQQSLEHLDRLNHATVSNLRDSEDPQLQGYAREFDLSRSEPDKLERLYLHMVLDGRTPQEVDDVIAVVTAGSWATRTAFMESVPLITQAIKNENEADVLLKDQDVLTLLRTVVTQVGEHQQDSGDLVTSEDLMTLLRPFCADGAVAVEKRLEILTILEQCFHLDDEDLVLLTLYRTEAVVSTTWPDKQMTEAHISSDQARTRLFTDLLAESRELEQFRSLRNLLQVWPQLEGEKEPSKQPWCQLLCEMVRRCTDSSSPDVVSIVRSLQESKPLSQQCLLFLHDVLLTHQMSLAAAKCNLLSDFDSLHLKAVELLKQATKVPGKQADSELYTLLLQRHLVAHVVETVYYPELVDFILSNQSSDGNTPYHISVETIANQLQDVGYEAEAVSLVSSHRGTHPALRTFDTALGLLNRWFSR